MKESNCWQEWAAKLFCFAALGAGAYLVIKYVFPVIMPFMASFAVAAAVSGVSKRISRLLRVPRGLCAVVIVSAVLTLIGFFTFYACRQLLGELKRILSSFASEGFSSLDPIFGFLERIPFLSPLISDTEEYAGTQLRPLVSRALSFLSDALSGFLGRAIRSTPTFFMGGVVTVVSCYYMSIDFDKICAFLSGLLPQRARKALGEVKGSVVDVIWKYLKAYAVLFMLTFIEILIGLWILCPSFAWLGALIVAAVDILPVLGAGLVLIPWAVVSLFKGEYFLGVGLLILYVVVTVVRQIAEPHLIGGSLGTHPLAAIIGMFVGYRLFGVVGMLLSPLLLSLSVKLLKRERS